MRMMDVQAFPKQINIQDIENLLKTRLGGTVVMWPGQAIALLGYMSHPNDEVARDTFMGILRLRVCAGLQGARHARPSGLPRAQEHTAHGTLHRAVADTVQELLALALVEKR